MLLVHEKVPVRRAVFPGSTSLYPLLCLCVAPRVFLQGFSCWRYLRVATFPPVSCISGCVKQWVTALCRNQAWNHHSYTGKESWGVANLRLKPSAQKPTTLNMEDKRSQMKSGAFGPRFRLTCSDLRQLNQRVREVAISISVSVPPLFCISSLSCCTRLTFCPLPRQPQTIPFSQWPG